MGCAPACLACSGLTKRAADGEPRPSARPSGLLAVALAQGKIERQGGGVLDLLHGEGRGDLRYFNAGDELLVEGVVGGDIGNDDPQKVVDLSAHAITFDH